MGIAVACGLPPAIGIITGIIGGLVVGLFAGSPLQVSGPAAGLIVLIVDILNERPTDGLAALSVIVVLAGVIQMLAGVFKLGQWFRAVSPAVMEGMLAGIGVLIFAGQFHIMVAGTPKAGGWSNLITVPDAFFQAIADRQSVHHHSAWAGALCISVLVAWKLLAPKRLALIPAALVAVVVATAGVHMRNLDIEMIQLPARLTDAIRFPDWSYLALLRDPMIWKFGVTAALIASAETMLCATAVDGMHDGPRTKFDKELTAHGIGNTICGFLGALPMTGVIVRSAANVEAGAKTRLSAVLHGAWLLLIVCFFPEVLQLIPKAVLAGILVYTGYKLVDVKEARRLFRLSRSEFAIYLVTIGVIIATDLLTGVVMGILLSAAKLLYTFSHLSIRVVNESESNRTTMYLEGAATFIRLPTLASELERIRPNTELHVHFENLSYVDHACLELLLDWEKQHEATGGSLTIDWDTLKAKFRPAV
jgi:MFS superfamily sulfate permease-like transporter